MTRRCIYRRVLLMLLSISIVGLCVYGYTAVKNSIPDKINVVAGSQEELSIGNFLNNAVVYENSMEVSVGDDSNIPSDELNLSPQLSASLGSYTMDCKLFGFIKLKSIEVSVVEQQYIYPSGEPVGIYIETDGILVVGTGSVKDINGKKCEPALNIVQSGDYIVAVNNVKVQNKQNLIDLVNESNGTEVTVTVRRNDEELDLNITPVQTAAEEYKLGIWVRNDTQGIGTLTFVDENNNFGALGHGITDVDTSTLMALSQGKLYKADILSIVKGEKGTPGELSGVIHYNDSGLLGEITSNTQVGIYGSILDKNLLKSADKAYEICYKQDIEIGKASILCSADGTVKEYEIMITDINLNDTDANKGLVLKVTDEELLALTGGIVQGMSGSPIIQNGKIIGAVTHVFIQDSTSGFGIFIENMLSQAE